MFLLIMLFFIGLLIVILFLVYKADLLTTRQRMPRAAVEELWDGKERRKYTRFKKNLEITYIVRKRPHLMNKASTVNISKGGMKLRLDEKLANDAIVDLKVTIPGTDVVAEIEAKVVWSGDGEEKDDSGKRYFHAGIEFIAAKPPTGDKLFDYIQSIASS